MNGQVLTVSHDFGNAVTVPASVFVSSQTRLALDAPKRSTIVSGACYAVYDSHPAVPIPGVPSTATVTKTICDAYLQKVIQRLTPPTDLPFGGLVDGQTYYVHRDAADPTNKFSLWTSADNSGTVITPNKTGLTATHHLGVEGIDLCFPTDCASTSTGPASLYVDISSAGTGRLLGAGGTDLRKLFASLDGKSTATSLGGSGALGVEVGVPKGDITDSPTVDACIGWDGTSTCSGTSTGQARTTVTAASDVKVSAVSSAEVNVTVDIRSGGIIQVGVARGKATMAMTTRAQVGDNAFVQAGRDLALLADATVIARVYVAAAGGGIIAVSDTDAAGDISFDTLVRFGKVSDALAGGDLSGHANTSIDGQVEAESFAAAGLLWSSADANHDNVYTPYGVKIVGTTKVAVDAKARLDATTVSLVAQFPSFRAAAHMGAEAITVLLVGVSKAYAEANTFVDVRRPSRSPTVTTPRLRSSRGSAASTSARTPTM